MSTNNPCQKCGFQIPVGRQRRLDYDLIKKMRLQGKTLAGLAKHFRVSKAAIQYAIKAPKK